MARRRSITSQLYRAARLSNTLGAVASGKPRRIARRARNIAVGRTLARAGVWRWLWKALKDAKLPRVRGSTISATPSAHRRLRSSPPSPCRATWDTRTSRPRNGISTTSRPSGTQRSSQRCSAGGRTVKWSARLDRLALGCPLAQHSRRSLWAPCSLADHKSCSIVSANGGPFAWRRGLLAKSYASCIAHSLRTVRRTHACAQRICSAMNACAMFGPSTASFLPRGSTRRIGEQLRMRYLHAT